MPFLCVIFEMLYVIERETLSFVGGVRAGYSLVDNNCIEMVLDMFSQCLLPIEDPCAICEDQSLVS